MRELEKESVLASELVEQTFEFWLKDQGHIRSPFPSYIRSHLKTEATEKFFNWARGISLQAKEEINDEIVGEKFEEIIFETALGLIKTEDERITILYPFLPRQGDTFSRQNDVKSTILDREIIVDGDNSFLRLTLKEDSNSETQWNTEIELPL
jgi:hypothetical protein